MKPVGGFFELEIKKGAGMYHASPYIFSNARACLNLIINTVKPVKMYVPFYSCNALIQPLVENNIRYEFYAVNEKLEPAEEIKVSNGEYLVYINYFGIKSSTVKKLYNKYGLSLIINNTQAYFESDYTNAWAFNSARKFFGVPDGAFLYSPVELETGSFPVNKDFHFNHLVDRFTGKQEQAYSKFREYEDSLNSDIKRVSLFSETLLSNINYKDAAQRRRRNFEIYESMLKEINQLEYELKPESVPFAYPLSIDKKIDKGKLFKQDIFIPTFWKDVLTRENSGGFTLEKKMTENILPLPVDQRYEESDIITVINALRKLI